MKCSFPSIILMMISLFALLHACAPTATQLVPTATTSSLPTLEPTHSPVPDKTSIPGFEDWSVITPWAVDIQVENSSLILTLKSRAVWVMSQRGVFFYKPVSGHFKITSAVHAMKSSDPSQSPGGDGTVQLGGLMARNGEGGKENYVFIVIGDDGNGLSVETKNTIDSVSEYAGPEWESDEAELRLCRFGQTFAFYKRPVDSSELWTMADTFERSDLPETLQVGVNIYTDSNPDLRIQFDDLRIEPISDFADCEED